MGEQSKEGEADEPASFDPFVRSEVEYDSTTRLHMAEDVASTRRLFVSPALKDIIVNPENFYHGCQQSAKMAEDANQRRQVSFNTKREAFIHQLRANGLPLPSKIPMIEINPTRVTLSLEFEAQYYSLMTNDYGNHENVASIMQQTNTLIQFPDRSESSHDPFVQQITITGHYSDVDKARKLMRDNCHVSIIMSLQDLKVSQSELQAFAEQNPIQNVDMFFLTSSSEKNGEALPHLRFTSRTKNEHELIQAANMILKKAYGNELQRKHPLIEQRTNVRISYPGYNTKEDIRGNLFTITINGTVENVLEARKYLMDLLPVSICFNMANTDMAAQSELADRCIHVLIEESRIMFKMTPSVYEPSELLSDEVPLHWASLRSKEFNIKHMYTAYQKVLAKKIEVVAPQPTDYDKSIWHRCLPQGFLFFLLLCRGESSDSSASHRRHRSTSVTSSQSKQGFPKGKSSSDVPIVPTRSQPRVSSVSECISMYSPPICKNYVYCFIAQPYHPMQMFTDPITHSQLTQMIMMQQQQAHALMKGSPLLQPVPFAYPIVFDQGTGAPICFPYHPIDPNFFQYPGIPISEGFDRSTNRQETSTSGHQTNSNKKPTRMMNRPSSGGSHHYSSSTHRPRRGYEQIRDDDARSSTRSGSRRTSTSGDEPTVGSYEDRGFDRQFSRHNQRYSKDDNMRWKTGSRGDINARRNQNFQKDFRPASTSRDYDFHVGSAGSTDRHASTDQLQFQSTHHLKLKPNEVDLDQERLFTHDSPQVDERAYPQSGFGSGLVDGDFVQKFISNVNVNDPKKRSRAVSCFIERDDQIARLTDSDCAYSVTDQTITQPSRSIDSFKKLPGAGVTKTMLEPRSRNEKEYAKINLEHKDKFTGEPIDEDKYTDMGPSFGSRQYRIDPMKLIASVRESSEQLPRIHERQFNDVLNDKERELAASAFKERNMETNLVQERSLDDTSPLDYAFRNDQSTDNIR
ncbi:CRE-GLD-3 protein [Caenorhabditis remanei]|uniref:CRE-GLD-3 protein n=1 Tax=Caenorhabditis remanei TaxID=31234 RepID=E3LQK3_CAERE|nr:CRE-GLD-3 protein [Caenorhabditis remanei]